jgi:hypothetical protein
MYPCQRVDSAGAERARGPEPEERGMDGPNPMPHYPQYDRADDADVPGWVRV